MKTSCAFTLIELLVVIAIIGILMALLIPVLDSVFQTAWRTSAKNDCTQIATAITAYENEYGRLPATNASGAQMSKDVLDALMGANPTLNPRAVVFLAVDTARKGKGGLSNNTFVDPWGKPYMIAYDDNYDSRITTAGTNNSTTIMRTVAVWNDPSTHGDNAIPTKKSKRYATSWD